LIFHISFLDFLDIDIFADFRHFQLHAAAAAFFDAAADDSQFAAEAADDGARCCCAPLFAAIDARRAEFFESATPSRCRAAAFRFRFSRLCFAAAVFRITPRYRRQAPQFRFFACWLSFAVIDTPDSQAPFFAYVQRHADAAAFRAAASSAPQRLPEIFSLITLAAEEHYRPVCRHFLAYALRLRFLSLVIFSFHFSFLLSLLITPYQLQITSFD